MSDELLHATPFEDILGIFAGNTRRYGKCKGVEKQGRSYRFLYKRAAAPLNAVLSPQGKLDGFQLGSPEFQNDSWEAMLADAKIFSPNKISVLYLKNNKEEVYSHEINTPLPVQRAGELFLLRAYEAAIEKGKLKRSDIARLASNHKFPDAPGALNEWA